MSCEKCVRDMFSLFVVLCPSDKDNLERSSDSSTSGFDSPAGKLVSGEHCVCACVYIHVHVYMTVCMCIYACVYICA